MEPVPADNALWTSAPIADRRQRKRTRKVNEILRATAMIIAEKGYHGMGLEDVAERLDLAKPSLYHYFEGKEELVYACLNTCADFVSQRLKAVADEPTPPLARLRKLIETQLRLTSRDYPEMAYLFLHPLDWPDDIRSALKKWRDEHNAIFRGVIREAIESGDLAPADETVSRMSLYGALNYAPMWLPRTKGPFERELEMVTGTVLAMFNPTHP